MFKTNFFKNILVSYLILASLSSAKAQCFQTTMVKEGNNLLVKIRPNGGDVSTGFANMEFYIRYPNSTTVTWGTPIANTTAFAGLSMLKDDPYTIVVETGYTIIRFYKSLGVNTTSATYTNATEYEVFRTSATGTGTASLEMMHRDLENPYVLTLVNEAANTERSCATKFYGAGVSSGAGFQSLTLSYDLPLELFDFTGKQGATDIKLHWQTTSERDLSHFSVEKSNSETAKFVEIGKVKAVGHSTTPQYYDLIDPQPSRFNYYRLKMIDTDGKSEYSKILSFKGKETKTVVSFYPNPAANVLNVVLTAKNYRKATVSILDITGKTIASQTVGDEAANRPFVFNLQGIQMGVYTAIVDIDGMQTRHKVIVEK